VIAEGGITEGVNHAGKDKESVFTLREHALARSLEPRSPRDPAERAGREVVVGLSHGTASCASPVTSRLGHLPAQVLLSDPLGGDVRAEALFLPKKPGPKTVRGTGSGFLSNDNDDPAAVAPWRVMRDRLRPRPRGAIERYSAGNGTRRPPLGPGRGAARQETLASASTPLTSTGKGGAHYWPVGHPFALAVHGSCSPT
jgi:hypothetical protein